MIILAVQEHCPARRLIKAVEQPQEGRFTRPTRSDHRQYFALLHLYADLIDQNLTRDRTVEMLGFERYLRPEYIAGLRAIPSRFLRESYSSSLCSSASAARSI